MRIKAHGEGGREDSKRRSMKIKSNKMEKNKARGEEGKKGGA